MFCKFCINCPHDSHVGCLMGIDDPEVCGYATIVECRDCRYNDYHGCALSRDTD